MFKAPLSFFVPNWKYENFSRHLLFIYLKKATASYQNLALKKYAEIEVFEGI